MQPGHTTMTNDTLNDDAVSQKTSPTENSDDSAFDHPCPIRDVLDRIGDRWSLLILEALAQQTLRFNELHRHIDDISRQMLSRTLKRLEADGFIHRTIYAEVPPRVEYTLTPLGHSFLQPMQLLIQWADKNHAEICRSRRQARQNNA
ncbi:helix-turn-helix domain-containing protein [Pectobacterium versatile]|uniref:winged helix-turn-helix transcriptional regulator n=1 Tax=Pectobacterium versatile TaxID=2488639 RepID=UPI001660AFDF|nr:MULTISPECIES: helix-turn-helix domain-containing protein [Pectobacterium]MBQ4793202.1 transcriptional regulator [Pectobacterium versatile]MCL6371358.1 transcriptional regulator [Pectobacterium atrosepticum]UNE78168.1 helix-turn-helix transcriptional regulator [Pectobacterium versatile]